MRRQGWSKDRTEYTRDGAYSPSHWIEVRSKGPNGRWEDMPNGPFPCSIDQWANAVEECAELDSVDPRIDPGWMCGDGGGRVREILERHCPRFTSFDALMLEGKVQGNSEVKRYGDVWR